MSQGTVSLEVKPNGLGVITFFHPAHNSMPSHLLSQLSETISAAGNMPEVRLILLQSEGDRTFCAGASFDELSSIENEEQGLRFFMGFARVINACRTCPKLIIGRVQGKAIGGGVGLASSTDYCLATTTAQVKLSELAVGIGPFVVGPAVQRKIGLAAFSQLAIHATAFQSAQWAMEKGLYQEVLPDIPSLDEAIGNLTDTLLASSPEAMAEIKKVCWQGTEHWDTLLAERAGISGRLVLSEFTREAIRRFKQKS